MPINSIAPSSMVCSIAHPRRSRSRPGGSRLARTSSSPGRRPSSSLTGNVCLTPAKTAWTYWKIALNFSVASLVRSCSSYHPNSKRTPTGSFVLQAAIEEASLQLRISSSQLVISLAFCGCSPTITPRYAFPTITMPRHHGSARRTSFTCAATAQVGAITAIIPALLSRSGPAHPILETARL